MGPQHSTPADPRETTIPRVTKPNRILEKVHLIWVKDSSSLYRKLSFNIIREVCQYLESDHWLVLIKKKEILLVDIETDTSQVLYEFPWADISADATSSATLIGGKNVFVCGGGEPWKQSCDF
jgi:hypothetical protein